MQRSCDISETNGLSIGGISGKIHHSIHGQHKCILADIRELPDASTEGFQDVR